MITSFLTFVLFVCLRLQVVIGTINVNQEQLDILSTVFGSEHVHAHFPTVETLSFHLAHHKQKKEATSDYSSRTIDTEVANTEHILACSSYVNGLTLGTDLKETFGDDNVQAIYVSKADIQDLFCYVCLSSAAGESEIPAAPESADKTFLVLPASNKVNTNLLELLNAETVGDLSNKRVQVMYGLGSGKGLQNIQPEVHVAALKTRLQGSAARGVESYEPLFGFAHRDSMNHDGFSKCHFDKLTHSTGWSYSTIDNLHAAFEEDGRVKHQCLSALVLNLIDNSHVMSVQLVGKPKPRNEYVAPFVQCGQNTGRVYSDAGLDGTGIVVGVADTGVDERSCFFANADGSLVTRANWLSSTPFFDDSKRKIIQYVNWLGDDSDYAGGHGTHVSGTVAGYVSSSASSTNAGFNGIAFGAKIALYDVYHEANDDFSVPDVYTRVLPSAKYAGAEIHTNSWGYIEWYSYTSDDVGFDTYAYQNEYTVQLVAAGNDGPGVSTVGAPALSKNVITVGASGSGHGSGINTIAYFSGRGPTFDARYGIDVLAQGYGTYSARASGTTSATCSYVSMSGTSMATPAVAAATAIVKQYFQDSIGWEANCHNLYPNCLAFTPKGSLLKAAIVHSGQNIGSYSYPGNDQGFGRVQLTNVLVQDGITPAGMDLYVRDDICLTSNTQTDIIVEVTSTSLPLKVTVVWMDPPNSVNAAKQVLNDIDLIVVSPSSTSYYGNGASSSGDEKNNVEQVYIASPAAGTYTVRVKSNSLTTPSQCVGLVITSHGYVNTGITASPTLTFYPTKTPTQIPTRRPTTSPPTVAPTLSVRPTYASFPSGLTQLSECGSEAWIGVNIQVAGNQGSCVSLYGFGDLLTISAEVAFSSASAAAWPADMAVVIKNPAGQGIQVGGYDITFLSPVVASWPDSWESSTAGTYTASLDVSGYVSGADTYTVCVYNGWSEATNTNYYGIVKFVGITYDGCNVPASATPTTAPTVKTPTTKPTRIPTSKPSRKPTGYPTLKPSRAPTLKPSRKPTAPLPTKKPTSYPTLKPSYSPTVSKAPASVPTRKPTKAKKAKEVATNINVNGGDKE